MTKQEILNYIFKSKDGASWNEVSEMLNELMEQPTEIWIYCNHHHIPTNEHAIVDFGDGEFVANKMAIPLLKALNELGLKTRTHHVDENGGFVSILIENSIRAEIKEVNELDAYRTKYNGKTELLISWSSKLPDKAKAGGQKTLKTVEQHEPRLNEPEQACFISHVSNPVCPSCGTDDIIYRFKTNSFICHKCVDVEWANCC